MTSCSSSAVLREISAKLGRVHGDLKTVQQNVSELVSGTGTEELCRSLGIASAGFLFLDVHGRVLRFVASARGDQILGDSTTASRSVRTPYYWSSSGAKQFEELIDALFVLVREFQTARDVTWAANEVECKMETEYVSYLPSVWRSAVVSEKARDLDLHYCQIGDIWLTIFVWRMLCCARDAGLGQLKLEELSTSLLDARIERKRCLWRDQDILGSESEKVGWLGQLAELWMKVACPGTTWRDELQQWAGSGPASMKKPMWRRSVSLSFARKIGIECGDGAGDFPDFLIRAARGLVMSLVETPTTGGVNSVSEAISTIERRARFPVLPFFLWNIIEDQPVTYLVAPVWTSQQYPVQSMGVDCRHIGLALCAVHPLSELELDKEISSSCTQCMESSVSVALSFLRLVAGPLVEGSLYSSAVAAARSDHKRLRDLRAGEHTAFGVGK